MKAGEGDNRGWDGWMASLTQWTWVWASSGRWWRTAKSGMLQSMGSQRVGHDWTTEQQQEVKKWNYKPKNKNSLFKLLSLSLSPCHMKTQQEGRHRPGRRRAGTRTWPCWHPDLRGPTSRTVWKYVPVVEATQSMILCSGSWNWWRQSYVALWTSLLILHGDPKGHRAGQHQKPSQSPNPQPSTLASVTSLPNSAEWKKRPKAMGAFF